MPDPEPVTDAGNSGVARGAGTSLSRLLVGGSAWSLASRFGQSFIMLAGTMVLARLLAPADFGVMAISTSLCLLMLVIAEGFIDFPLLRSDNLTENRLQSLLWAGLGMMVVLALISALLAPLVEQAFGFAGLAGVIRASGIIFLTQAVMVAGRALLRRQHRFRETGLLVVASALVYVATAAALALADWGVWSLVIGQIASSAALALLLARAAGLSLRWPHRFDLSGVLRTGGLGLMARVLAWVWASLDTIAVGLAASASATGFYSRAYNLSTQVKEPFAALDHPVRQALSASRSRAIGYETVFRESSRVILVLATQASVAVAVMSGFIVSIILGPQWTAAAPVLAILALGIPARIANNLLDGDAVVDGDMSRMVTRHLLLAVAIGVSAVLTAPLGIEAVATAVVASLYLPVLVQVSPRSGLKGTWRAITLIMPALASGAVTYAVFTVMKPVAKANLFGEGAILIGAALGVTIITISATCPVFVRSALQAAGLRRREK